MKTPKRDKSLLDLDMYVFLIKNDFFEIFSEISQIFEFVGIFKM